jgi:hypothetical protein
MTIATTVADGLKLASTIATLAETLDPQFAIAGFTLQELEAAAQGIADGVPAVQAALADIEAAATGGTPPTPAQLLALKAAIDADDDKIQQDVTAADASGKA